MYGYSESGVEDMVEVDGKEVEKPLAASGGDCVAGVVNVGPGIGSLGQAAVGHQVQHTLRERESEDDEEKFEKRDVPCMGISHCP